MKLIYNLFEMWLKIIFFSSLSRFYCYIFCLKAMEGDLWGVDDDDVCGALSCDDEVGWKVFLGFVMEIVMPLKIQIFENR